MENKPVYKETQSFVTWWIRLLFVTVVGGVFYTWWMNPEGKMGEFSLGAVIGLAVFGLIFFVRLHSRIDTEGIHIRFFPFIWREKTWRWDEMVQVYVKKYSIWEYGGWGYRLSGAGTAYTTRGTCGIQIVLRRNGTRILVGTQRPREVEEILKQYQHNDEE